MQLSFVMKNTDIDNIIRLENLIQSYGHEFQSIGKEIKVYLLNDAEIHIIVNKTIEIYTHNIEDFDYKYSLESFLDAVSILKLMLTS